MRIKKYLKKLSQYETCSSNNGDICYNPYCAYSIMHLDSNETLYFTCGKIKEKYINKEGINK